MINQREVQQPNPPVEEPVNNRSTVEQLVAAVQEFEEKIATFEKSKAPDIENEFKDMVVGLVELNATVRKLTSQLSNELFDECSNARKKRALRDLGW